jgi:hypothetical protein
MANYQFEFANPASHADWARYAKFDRTTGSFAPPVQSVSPMGIKPPQNLSQMVEQETQNISETWNAAKQFGSQVLGGNFGGSFNSAINPNEQPAPTTTIPITNPYNYKKQLEDQELSQGLDNLDDLGSMAAMA